MYKNCETVNKGSQIFILNAANRLQIVNYA